MGSCYGKKSGTKTASGRHAHPEGIFQIESIEDARHWGFYEDSVTKERIGYGPYFIRLKTGWKGIGIHGTGEDHLHEIGKMQATDVSAWRTAIF